jgi:hypothetical protein
MTRQPLSDLNIMDFITPSSASCSKKRPLNPNLVLSPSKRRVLDSEGIPYLSPKPRSTLSGLAKADIPARKLDFGSPKSIERFNKTQTLSQQTLSLAGPHAITTVTTTTKKTNMATKTTTNKSSAPNRLNNSPLTSTTIPRSELDNPFATPRSTTSRLFPSPSITPVTPQSERRSSKRDSVFEDITERNASLWQSPRKTTTDYYYSDRHSEHYPGFDIYYDPICKETLASAPRRSEEEEETKENTQPSRKNKKTVVSLSNSNVLVGTDEDTMRCNTRSVAKHK